MPRKRSFTKTTDSHHRFRYHPNLVKDAPKLTAANPLYMSITYLPTRQSTVYLSLVLKIIGCHVHNSLHTAGCLAALAQAVLHGRQEKRRAAASITPTAAANTAGRPTRLLYKTRTYALPRPMATTATRTRWSSAFW